MDPESLLNTLMAGELTETVEMDETPVIPEEKRTEIETEILDVESIGTESMTARGTMTETGTEIEIMVIVVNVVNVTEITIKIVTEIMVVDIAVEVAAVDTALPTTLSFVSLLVVYLKVVLGKISKITSDK